MIVHGWICLCLCARFIDRGSKQWQNKPLGRHGVAAYVRNNLRVSGDYGRDNETVFELEAVAPEAAAAIKSKSSTSPDHAWSSGNSSSGGGSGNGSGETSKTVVLDVKSTKKVLTSMATLFW